MRNAADVLRMARVHVPDVSCTESYLSSGCAPAFVWLWNPAMGPLWSVVAQKVAGGSLAEGSEVELEIAELCWKDVAVDGSLLVRGYISLQLNELDDFSEKETQKIGIVVSIQGGAVLEDASVTAPCWYVSWQSLFFLRIIPKTQWRFMVEGVSTFTLTATSAVMRIVFEISLWDSRELDPEMLTCCT